MNGKRICGLIVTFIMILQAVSMYSVFAAGSVKITKFTKSPEKPDYSQTILFRVRTEGEVEKVTLSIDGEKEFPFSKKSSNIWELEKKLSIEGTRYLKVVATGKDGKDTITDTMEVVAKKEWTAPEKKETEETTTERVFTGNVEKKPEETTEPEKIPVVGGDDFDGGVYNEKSAVDDSYFEFARDENLDTLNQAAKSSVFMFVGDSMFINKWKKEYIDPENTNVVSYIKNGYTLVPLRVIAEAFDAKVSWEPNAKRADIVFSGSNISVTAGDYAIKINGRENKLDVCTEIKDGRVFVPLRAIAEGFNKNVYYNNKFIGITSKTYNLSDKGLELIRQAVLRGVA